MTVGAPQRMHPSYKGGDPTPPQPMHPSYLVGDPNADATPRSLKDQIGDAWLNLYQVSAPGIAASVLHKQRPGLVSSIPGVGPAMEDAAAPVDQLPSRMGENLLLMPSPETEGGEAGDAAPRAAQPARVAPQPQPSSSGLLSRVREVALRRASNIPGVQAAKDVNYVLRGDAPDAAPAAPAPAVPDYFGKGRYGTPVSDWGQRVQTGQTARPRLVEQMGGEPVEQITKPAGSAGSMVDSVVSPASQSLLERLRGFASNIPSDEESAPEDEDLTPILQESLKQAMARKAALPQ